jgi:hypothetical protein
VSPLVVVRETPRSALVSVTLAPFTAKPAGSTTRPLSVAVNAADDCP